MKRLLKLCFILLWGMIFLSMSGAKIPDIKAPPLNIENPGIQFSTIPLYFIPNKGQVHEKAKFYARTSAYTLWLTQDGLVFDSIKRKGKEANRQRGGENIKYERDVSRLIFLGARKNPAVVPAAMSGYRVNYFKGTDRAKWFAGIRTSKAVLYKNLYENVDLKVYGMEKQIEYDWIVKPGGSPEDIRFQYENVKGTRIDASGNLVVETRLGELTHQRPVSFQYINGPRGAKSKVAVNVTFKKVAENTYGLAVGRYDKGRELIIDPVLLAYSTYLGGGGDEMGIGLAVDGGGRAYLTGITGSSDFPTDDAYQNTSAGDQDVFVTKFSASGTGLVYSTYLGGNSEDTAEGIQVDSSGRAYVAGRTSSHNFPTQSAYQSTFGGGDQDAFVTVLSSSGSSLAYSTYLGGSGRDRAYAIALSSGRDIFVTGQTTSSDFPTENAYRGTFVGGHHDAFVTRIDSSGSSLVYSTYLGGGGKETGYGIAVNGSNAYVAGRTTSTNFPTQNEYQGSHAGSSYDVFVTKFSTAGNSLIYSTYLGGGSNDNGWGIAVDGSGCAYVTGDTASTGFPTLNAYQNNLAGARDAFVTKFAATGTTLEYSTYLGGSEDDASAHVVLNSSGYACLSGFTRSSDFPVKRAYQNAYNGDLDVFVSMLSPTGDGLSFSTFLGGSDMDTARGIVVDGSGDIYAAGYTDSADFPTGNAYQDALAGDRDAFVCKFSTAEFGTLCGGVDNCNLNWTTGGAADWFEQTDTYYYDGDALQSGAMTTAENSYLQTTVTGPGQLSFWWQVYSYYSGYGVLKFYIDDVEQNSISGTGGGWQQKTYSIAAGNHTLKWSYEKSYSYSYVSDCGWVDKVEYNPETSIVLNRTQLTFGAVLGSTSDPQTFSVASGSSCTMNWTAAGDKSWLSCSPDSGSGGGVVAVTVDPTWLPAGKYTGTVSVSAPNATNSPRDVSVTLNVYNINGSSVPFGDYSTPIDYSTVRSSVPFTGWVLDDLGVQSVKLYRQSGGTSIYIGDALFVEGARPDVESANPGYPDNYKAGWGYMMLTNFLPNSGNGTFIIEAIATDVEGHHVSLGSKTITADNDNAVKPFGAIDTPAQGGTASGAAYLNQGWVLTPQPNSIPTDGSTIFVWVDGVSLGQVTYNLNRADVAALFPTYANSSGAGGRFYIDTTAYDNGVHSIYWTASDSGGNSDGVGSRFFSIRNTGNSPRARAQGQRLNEDLSRVPIDYSTPVKIKKGFKQNAEPEMVYPDDNGIFTFEIKELERLEIHLDENRAGGGHFGYQLVGRSLKGLPIGSTMDSQGGIFYWQPGPGFTGAYRFVFFEKDLYGEITKRFIDVKIVPKFKK